MALLIPSYTPIYTEDWDFAPFIIGSSIAAGVFNFVGYALVDSAPKKEANYKEGDKFQKNFGITLFTVGAIVKVLGVVLDIARATEAVKDYNEKLRNEYFITKRFDMQMKSENDKIILAFNSYF
jgi:hypothetical protein